MKVIFKALLFVVLLANCCNEINAQNTAKLRIELVDQNSATVSQGDIHIIDVNGKFVDSKNLNGKSNIEFERLLIGSLTIEVISPGFELIRKTITIREGLNSLVVKLEIKKIEENLVIKPSEIDSQLSQAFSRIMTQKEINSLPNEPGEIKKELQRRFGDDVIISVNGFTGGLIPPKEAIRSIEASLGSFDTEFHELAQPRVNIITKASIPKLIANIGFNYGNSALNARNALAPDKRPEQNHLIYGFLTSPVGKRSSLSLSFSDVYNIREELIIAKTIESTQSTRENSAITSQNFSADFNSDIGNNFTLCIMNPKIRTGS